jgi:hypothetical protein
VLRLLCRFDDSRLVEIPFVVDIELAEGILQSKDFSLLELRIFPAQRQLAAMEARRGSQKLSATYRWSLITFMAEPSK